MRSQVAMVTFPLWEEMAFFLLRCLLYLRISDIAFAGTVIGIRTYRGGYRRIDKGKDKRGYLITLWGRLTTL